MKACTVSPGCRPSKWVEHTPPARWRTQILDKAVLPARGQRVGEARASLAASMPIRSPASKRPRPRPSSWSHAYTGQRKAQDRGWLVGAAWVIWAIPASRVVVRGTRRAVLERERLAQRLCACLALSGQIAAPTAGECDSERQQFAPAALRAAVSSGERLGQRRSRPETAGRQAQHRDRHGRWPSAWMHASARLACAAPALRRRRPARRSAALPVRSGTAQRRTVHAVAGADQGIVQGLRKAPCCRPRWRQRSACRPARRAVGAVRARLARLQPDQQPRQPEQRHAGTARTQYQCPRHQAPSPACSIRAQSYGLLRSGAVLPGELPA